MHEIYIYVYSKTTHSRKYKRENFVQLAIAKISYRELFHAYGSTSSLGMVHKVYLNALMHAKVTTITYNEHSGTACVHMQIFPIQMTGTNHNIHGMIT